MTSFPTVFRKKRKSRLTGHAAALYAGRMQSSSSMQADSSELEGLFINRGMMRNSPELPIQGNMALNIPTQQEIK